MKNASIQMLNQIINIKTLNIIHDFLSINSFSYLNSLIVFYKEINQLLSSKNIEIYLINEKEIDINKKVRHI